MPRTKKEELKVEAIKETALVPETQTAEIAEVSTDVRIDKAKKITLITSLSIIGLLIIAIATLAIVKVSTFPNVTKFDYSGVLDLQFSVKNYSQDEVEYMEGDQYTTMQNANDSEVTVKLFEEMQKAAKQTVLTAMFSGNLGQNNLNNVELITDSGKMGTDAVLYSNYDYVVKIYLEKFEFLKNNDGGRLTDSSGNYVAYDILVIALNSTTKTSGQLTIVYNTVGLTQNSAGWDKTSNHYNTNYKYQMIIEGSFNNFYNYVKDNIK